MYTESVKRQKSNAFFQMKTLSGSNDRERVIEKLGSSIYSSMDRLQSLKASILSADVENLKPLILEFQRENASFIDKQKSLMEIEDSSEKLKRLKTKVKQFLEVFSPDDIEKRLASIKEDRIRESNRDVMERQQQIQKQKYEGQSFTTALLNEQEQQIKEIQKLMSVVKQIAIDTSNLVVAIGVKLDIASESMRTARDRIKQGKQELVETNTYEQDTCKTKALGCGLIFIILVVLLLLFRASR